MNSRYRFTLVYLMLTLTWAFIYLSARTAVPVVNPLAKFPAACQEWRMTSQVRFSNEILSVLKPTDYLSREYESLGGRRIRLYIGYHDGGKKSGEIHSPKNCLPGNGWQQVSTEQMHLSEQLGNINLVKAVYQKGESRELFLYWFQMQQKTFSNEYSLKLAGISNSIIHGRKDTSFIRVSVPFEVDEKEATEAGINFIRDMYPLMRDFIPV